MSDDLVKRLRNTPNWLREGFNDWKDNVKSYDRAPFEAADRIEQLAATCEELEAANKRLNEQMDAIEEMGTESLNALPDCLMRLAPALVENDELKAKLAKAAEALKDLADCVEDGCFCSEMQMATAIDIARATLAELKGNNT